jgi:P27 family predicted phage terminase small subunit
MPGGKGRKPKPTAQKKLAGNPGKRALNNDEPEFDAVTDVSAPEHLKDFQYAAEQWDTLAPQLCSRGVMTVADLWNLESFCLAYSMYRAAMAEANGIPTISQDNGTIKKNPALSAANEALRQMQSLGAVLGLDPANRSRIIAPGGKKTEANPFLEMMNILGKK